MILFEFEGKNLLSASGIRVPKSQLVESPKDKVTINLPLFIKSQVLSGKRKDVGGIVEVNEKKDIVPTLTKMLGVVVNKEKVSKLLLEEKIDFEDEYYISVSYNTDLRSPVITYSEKGGTGIEDRKSEIFPINILTLEVDYKGRNIDSHLKSFVKKMIEMFLKEDATLVEINPVVITKKGEILALDAKIKLEDTAKSRHSEWNFPPRNTPGHSPTQREIEAKKIDEGDYRGTAGAAYFDLPGDIAILSSGGGVSLTALDALLTNGGKPANFTEYSGNPPKEKVIKLTKIVLDKPSINGLWVIGTVVANFTDIYETLSGLIEGLREAEKELKTKFDFPIVIRRGGPRDEEAFEMLKKVDDFNLILQGQETSIVTSAKVIVEEARKYANGKKTN